MCRYIDELKKHNYKKNSIKNIAKKYGLSESQLKKYYQTKFFQNIAKEVDLEKLSKLNIDEIEKILESETLKSEFKFIKVDLESHSFKKLKNPYISFTLNKILMKLTSKSMCLRS